MTEDSDASTLMHELGHYYLEEITRIAALQGESSGAGRILMSILQWGGLTDMKQWIGWSTDQRRELHEAFAMSFERWLYEGVSPSRSLDKTFTSYRGWLTGVYTDVVQKLNKNYRKKFERDLPGLTSEIKEVFGTMVATEAEVGNAVEAENFEVLFESQEEWVANGGTFDEYTALMKAHDEAQDKAVDDLTRQRLKQMELASGATQGALKKMQAKHNVRRREIRKEVEAQEKLSVWNRLRSWLRNGEHLDESGELVSTLGKNTGHKLNRGAVAGRMEVRDVRKLDDANALANNGLDLERVSDMFAYENADAMLADLANKPDLGDAVKAEVDKRMRQEHPELTDPKLIREQVAEAIHNKVRRRQRQAGASHTARGAERSSPQGALDEGAGRVVAQVHHRRAPRSPSCEQGSEGWQPASGTTREAPGDDGGSDGRGSRRVPGREGQGAEALEQDQAQGQASQGDPRHERRRCAALAARDRQRYRGRPG